MNWQFLLFKWCKMPLEKFKGFDAKYHPSRVNECKFPEELFPRELSTATCIVQEFLARIKRWVEFVISKSTKIFLKWKKLEYYTKLEQRLLLVDSRSSRVSRVETPELLETKQRPFRIDESCRNRESRIKMQQSRMESLFLTRFSVLYSRVDRESSVNLLLNGTVGWRSTKITEI